MTVTSGKVTTPAPLWVFNLRVPVELRPELERVAREHNRSLHGEVLTAVEAWLRKHQGEVPV